LACTHCHLQKKTIHGILGILLAMALAISLVACGDEEATTEDVPVSLDEAQNAYESGDFEGAAADLEALVADNPEDLEVRRSLALALASQGDNEGAIEQYLAIVESDPIDHASFYRLALLERVIGLSLEAATHLESAVDLLPRDASYRDELARTYAQLGRYMDAAEQWGTVLADENLKDEGRVELLKLQAEAYVNAKEYDLAEQSLEAALMLAPNDEALKARLETFE
jgi:Flp pilus assembly protein TadD